MKIFLSFLLLLLYSVFTPLNAAELPSQFKIKVPRPDKQGKDDVTFVLTKYSVRDPDFFKLYVDEQRYSKPSASKGANRENFTELDVNDFPVRTYRGYVLEEPNSTVIAVIWPGDETISAIINEGKRVLWTVDDLVIDPTKRKVGKKGTSASTLNIRKSWDWKPTFGSQALDLTNLTYTQSSSTDKTHGWPVTPRTQEGISRVQLAVDAEPEWFAQQAKGSPELALAIIEHSVNVLDVVYVRDLSMNHVLTSYIQRTDTNFHIKASDTIKTWKDNGLGYNPGSTNASIEKSIPFQQMIWAYVNEGNPFAYRSQSPLDGGNYSRVPINAVDASGLSHEIGHNWGGSHFVYPRDSMSGGGPWFGPTTVQRMIFLKNASKIGDKLPKITNQQYGWNVHPYAMPDLVRTEKNQQVVINVIGNDFDGNNDPIAIASFESSSLKGGKVTKQGNKLLYTPKPGFQGRDSFTYLISDGEFTNDAWVQIDVGGDLLLSYQFESVVKNTNKSIIKDSSGSNSHAELINFVGKELIVEGVVGNGLYFPWLMTKNDKKLSDRKSSDKVRPFLAIDDVFDPLDGDQSISLWVKFDKKSLQSGMPVYLLSNSSSVIHNLVSGYNIYTDKSGKSIHFELREQLTPESKSVITPMRSLIYETDSGLSAEKWYNVVFVINRTSDTISAYVNGEPIKAAKDNLITLTPGSVIKGKPGGGRYISSGLGISTYKPKKYGPFSGVMDEFNVYARALSANEVKENWSKLSGKSTQQK